MFHFYVSGSCLLHLKRFLFNLCCFSRMSLLERTLLLPEERLLQLWTVPPFPQPNLCLVCRSPSLPPRRRASTPPNTLPRARHPTPSMIQILWTLMNRPQKSLLQVFYPKDYLFEPFLFVRTIQIMNFDCIDTVGVLHLDYHMARR